MDLYIFLGMCAELKDLNLKIVYKHQGRKPTSFRWWVVHFAYQNHTKHFKIKEF